MPSLGLTPDIDYTMIDQHFNQLDRQFNDTLSLDSLSINVDDPLGDNLDEDASTRDSLQKEEDVKAVDIKNEKVKKIIKEYEDNSIALNGGVIKSILKECQGSTLKDRRTVRRVLLGNIK